MIFTVIGYVFVVLLGLAGVALVSGVLINYIWRKFIDVYSLAAVCQEARRQGRNIWKKREK